MIEFAPSRFDVLHMKFRFSERKGYKFRPVLVIDGSELDAVAVAMVAGAESKISFPHDVFLDDWREAGLDKRSIARLDKMARLSAADTGSAGVIGHLSLRDAIRVASMLEQFDADC